MHTDLTQHQTTPNRGIFAALLLLVGFVMLGLVVGNLLGLIVSLPLFGADYQAMIEAFANPTANPESRRALLIVQACSSLFGFVLSPLAFYVFIEKKRVGELLSSKGIDPTLMLLVGGVVISFMVVNSVVIEWNMNLDLGIFSSAFEEWASAKEAQLKELTEYLTRFDNIGGLLVGILVIAVLPALGEEIVFRGLAQPMFHRLFNNPHAGIWVAAFLFSFIHLQFYGFFPRFLLGALFGYIYYWSGNLWYPIFAHFVNNGFTLVMLYMYQQQVTDMNVEDTESVPIYSALLALLATVTILYYIRKKTVETATQGNE